MNRSVPLAVLIIGLTLGAANTAAGGILPACPTTTPTELAKLLYARDVTGSTTCATFVSCSNFDKKSADVICQFFNDVGTQAGTDVHFSMDPTETGACATRGADPVGIRSGFLSASSGPFEGIGRICADSNKLAYFATLSCSTAGGVAVERIPIILKKQKGD